MPQKLTSKEAVLKYLEGVEEATADKIAKKTKMSWATANTACIILKSDGKLNQKIKYKGYQKTSLWSLKV